MSGRGGQIHFFNPFMDHITAAGLKQVWLENHTPGHQPAFPFAGRAFVCVLWNNVKDSLSPEPITQLLNANCKYIVAGGHDSEKWHDLADHLFISRYPDYAPPDSEHVMTTWHQDEPLEEVLWFGLNNTDFDDYRFTDYLVLQIGECYSPEYIGKLIDGLVS